MTTCQYLLVDVFTDQAFGGNPLAVFPAADALDPTRMQAIAREMNLSETVFCVQPSRPQADVRLRIFTVDQELPLAGHPTVGAVHALVAAGHVECGSNGGVVWCELGVGVLPVEVEVDDGRVSRVVMTQRPPRFAEPIADVASVAAALGVRPAALGLGDLPVRIVDTGIPWLVIPIADLLSIRQLTPDPARCRKLAAAVGVDRFYVFTQDVQGAGVTAHARHAWFGTVTPGEDPATGSAAGCLAAYLVHEGVVLASPDAEFTIEQGIEIGRPSRIDVRVDTSGRTIEQVKVGGCCVMVGRGELTF